ncbi:MAG: CDP-diacylglycerol--serine O-phosphatidyltransferase [Cyclobacteriaceae bacterium]|nr:CDP-diacylglycerol--serine O-phosphatidyltransferase [Cyclobacteriaceae bacterium]
MFTIPNFLTLGNLITGTLGIISVINQDPKSAFFYIVISVLFDYADGFVARKLKMHSDIGKELDSLADMVSFGVLPGITMLYMMESVSNNVYLPYISLMIIGFSALRLAKFNIDERQSDTFYGLPTPANALFLTSLPHMNLELLENVYVLGAIAVVFSLLLVSEIKMFALKFKNFSFAQNKWKFLAILLSAVCLYLMGIAGIPLIILSYILFSIVSKFFAVDNK